MKKEVLLVKWVNNIKMKISSRKVFFLSILMLLLLSMGTSFAYYLANVRTTNEENKTSEVTTSTITKVVMDMQGDISSDGAYPGHMMVKEVVVRGIGDVNAIDANAKIKVSPNLGEFKDDVVWRLYQSEEEIACTNTLNIQDGTYYETASCKIPSSASLELEGTSSALSKDIVVSPSSVTKYYLVIEYLNKENQNNQMGEAFSVNISLDTTDSEEIIKDVDNSVDFTMTEEVAGIKVNSYGDGVYEINGTTTEQVNVRLSDYFMTSSPNGNGLFNSSHPNNNVIMEKGKTYRIKYEYLSGSNTVDKYNSFRLVFSEPNSYRGLQTFAYDFYAGFVGTEKMIYDIGMYFLWISKGYSFNNFKFQIKVYEIVGNTDDLGSIADVATLDKNGTSITAVWYDTGVMSVFGVNDMNVSEWSRQTTYINLTTRKIGFAFSEIYDDTLASNPPYLSGNNVKMTYKLISNSPNIDTTADYKSQVYFELMNTASSPKTIKPPSISSESDDLGSSEEVVATGTLKNDISTPILIIGKNVNIQKPWRFKFDIEKVS